jgi:hypothetical protein
MSQAQEDDLSQAFKDIVEWKNTGTLRKDSPIRKWHQDFEESNNMDYPIHGMENQVLFEIAKRYFEAKEIVNEMMKEKQ